MLMIDFKMDMNRFLDSSWSIVLQNAWKMWHYDRISTKNKDLNFRVAAEKALQVGNG